MFYHVEERRVWIRRGAHTVVRDDDPDFTRFAQDKTGSIRRTLRIWLAEPGGDRPCLHVYLGAVTLCATYASYRDLYRLFRFTSRAANAAGQSSRALRHVLANLLRDYMDEGKEYPGLEGVGWGDIGSS